MKKLGAYLLLVALTGCCAYEAHEARGPMPGAASQVLSQERHASATHGDPNPLVASSSAARVQEVPKTSEPKTEPAEEKVQYMDAAPSATYLR